MRLTWRKGPAPQLDLLDAKAPSPASAPADATSAIERLEREVHESVASTRIATSGAPMLVPVSLIDEDPNNPRTDFLDAEIDELADGQLHETEPDKVRALVDGDAVITRAAVAAIKTERVAATPIAKPGRRADAIARANAACARLEQALKRIERLLPDMVASPELVALRTRVESFVQ